MTSTSSFLAPATALLVLACTPVLAEQGWVEAQNNRARLTWCRPETQKGPASFAALIEIALDPGWKTYWRVPGDSGVAPDFDFAASANVANARVLYPRPHRIIDREGASIGYTGAVSFPVHFDVPDANAPVSLAIDVSYGVCKDICVPVEVKLIPTCSTSDAKQLQPLLRAADALVPRPAEKSRPGDPHLVSVSGSIAAPVPKLAITVDFGAGATDADVFIEAPDQSYVPLPERPTPDANGRATVTLDLSKTTGAKDLLGKPLRLTMVSTKGASEAMWTAH